MSREVWIANVACVHAREKVSAAELTWLKQRKFLKVMDDRAMQALQAVHLAARQSLWNVGISDDRLGVVVSVEDLDSGRKDWDGARELARAKGKTSEPAFDQIGNCLPPLALIPRLPNSIAGHISREFGATGPCWTSGGGNQGLDGVIQGSRWIADEVCDRILVVCPEVSGAVAVTLQSTSVVGGRRISGWSNRAPDAPENLENGTELRGVQDWENWAKGPLLWSRRAGNISQIHLTEK